MIKIDKPDKCCGCAACANACPKHCITMMPDKKGFHYPLVDTSVCIHCDLCEKVCPLINNADTPSQPPLEVEAVASKSRTEVINSSSGAVCQELSSYFISEKGGVVYGATWSDGFVVRHIRVTEPADLEKIRCSKYLQSQIGDTFKNVKEDLAENRSVLFIGTPCQVAGLKDYLRKDYENLTTVDFVCHGVPSQSVFNRVIAHIEKYGVKVKSVNFRSKEESWREFGTMFCLQNGENLYVRHSKSFFSVALCRICTSEIVAISARSRTTETTPT